MPKPLSQAVNLGKPPTEHPPARRPFSEYLSNPLLQLPPRPLGPSPFFNDYYLYQSQVEGVKPTLGSILDSFGNSIMSSRPANPLLYNPYSGIPQPLYPYVVGQEPEISPRVPILGGPWYFGLYPLSSPYYFYYGSPGTLRFPNNLNEGFGIGKPLGNPRFPVNPQPE